MHNNCHEHADCVQVPSNRTISIDELKQPPPSPGTSAETAAKGGLSRCLCRHGYVGNGLYCDPISDQCTRDLDCGLHGRCLNEQQMHSGLADPLPGVLLHEYVPLEAHPIGRRCGCIQDYFRHPESGCIPLDQATCDFVPNCHEKASCKFNVRKHRYECDCNENYRGDGKHCEPILQHCNVLNNCDSKANCVYNQRIREHQCVCNPGYNGDG